MQDTLKWDTHAAKAIAKNLQEDRSTIFVEGDGNCFFRAMSVCLWLSEYYYAHLKLFVLAYAVKHHAALVTEGHFLRSWKCESHWEQDFMKRYTPSMMALVAPNDTSQNASPGGDDYAKLLLAQIAIQCRDGRWAGPVAVYLACEALRFPVKVLCPEDVLGYKELGLSGRFIEGEEGLYDDSRYSATHLARGEPRSWCLRGAHEGDDFCPEEIAVVLTEFQPAKAIDIAYPWSPNNNEVGDLKGRTSNHYAAIVHDFAFRDKRKSPGPPFPLDVAAPPRSKSKVRAGIFELLLMSVCLAERWLVRAVGCYILPPTHK